MVGRGSTEPKDRLFAALPYLLPLIDVLPFGRFLLGQFPFLAFIFLPIKPLIDIYYGFPFAGIIVFFVLFLAVVRNSNISHFIRFNTLQAILIDILLILFGLVTRFLLGGIGIGLLTETLFNVAFLGVLAACIYAIVQSALGRYAEIPTISEAAYSQLPY